LGDWILQKALADEMTMLVHGTEGLHLAQRCSRALFEGTLESFAGLGQATIEQLIGKAAIFDLKWDSALTLGALANRTRTDRILGSSLLTKGAFKMNGERLIDPSMRLPEQMTDVCLPGTRLTLICWGKRKYSLVRWC